MALGLGAALVGAVGAQIVGSLIQGVSAGKAAKAQTGAAEAGISEEARRFDALQKLLAPYVEAGTGALGGLTNLLGLGEPGAEAKAIGAIQQSPEFQALTQTGEEAILQNASATGGLRGGNVQAALAQFRPQVLSQLIQDRFGRLGTVAGLGQSSAAGVGNAGIATGTNIAQLYGDIGAAQAGKSVAQGQAFAQPFQLGSTLASLASLKALKVF